MVNLEELGYTESQLIEKYGTELTKKILLSDIFNGASIALNEDGKNVYYFIDVENAIKGINI